MKKLHGFTLAEVLIAMTIVGVIAMLTLPTLKTSTNLQTHEAAIKKTYNTISNAVDMYMAEQGVSDLTESDLSNNPDGLRNFIDTYFKVVQDCGNKPYTTASNCLSESYTALNRTTTKNNKVVQCNVAVALTDGTGMCVDVQAMPEINNGLEGDKKVVEYEASNIVLNDNIVMRFVVDTNGPLGPNLTGYDIFSMVVGANGIVHGNLPDLDKLSDDAIVTYYNEHALPMSIKLIQKNGWKITYRVD